MTTDKEETTVSNTKQFDVPEVLAALEAAVAEKGADYVYERPYVLGMGYPACLYTHKAEDGALIPGCIVGQVYRDLTGNLVPLTSDDQEGTVRENPYIVSTFTAPAQDALSAAQMIQDGGKSWGEALDAARRAAGV